MADLSVIIPTYNRARLVPEAIDSVIEQKCAYEIEIIVIDDGSQDDTARVLSGFGTSIRYSYQPNRGINAARNAGISMARGRYISLLDSDDVWLPFKADVQIRVMDAIGSVAFAFTDFFMWRGRVRQPHGLSSWMAKDMRLERFATSRLDSRSLGIVSEEDFDVVLCDIYRLSLHQPVVLPSTSIIRREALDECGPLPEDSWMCGDWEFFARASKRFGAAYIDMETTLNRGHDDGVRLMRRSLSARTVQRVDSIRRTWRQDGDFLAEHADEVDRVEAAQLAILFKEACYEKDFRRARRYLQEIRDLKAAVPRRHLLLYWLMHLPAITVALSLVGRASR